MPYDSQHFLTEGELLDERGHLREAGCATRLCRRYERAAVRAGRTQKITVTAVKGWLPAHADGETLCEKGKRLEISLLPHMLEVITIPPVLPGA